MFTSKNHLNFTPSLVYFWLTLYTVYFPSKDTGYAVGRNGAIVNTVNGGTNWALQTSGTTDVLYSVFFTDANTGYAVGGDQLNTIGMILKTTNGGVNWTPQIIPPANTIFSSVYFPAPDTGYVVGFNGTIIKTTDGGVTGITENNKEGSRKVYPNPSAGIFQLSTINYKGPKVEIYNVMGEKIFQSAICSQQYVIDISSQPSGIYFLQLKTETESFSQKIIIQK